MQRPTPVQAAQIVAAVGAGAMPWVAAEATGVSSELFTSWMRSLEPDILEFQDQVRRAAARARLDAEMRVRKDRPLEWLTKGPGKTEPGRPGWSDRVEMTGADGGPVQQKTMPPAGPDLTKLSKEELDIYERLLAKLAG